MQPVFTQQKLAAKGGLVERLLHNKPSDFDFAGGEMS